MALTSTGEYPTYDPRTDPEHTYIPDEQDPDSAEEVILEGWHGEMELQEDGVTTFSHEGTGTRQEEGREEIGQASQDVAGDVEEWWNRNTPDVGNPFNPPWWWYAVGVLVVLVLLSDYAGLAAEGLDRA